MITPLLDEAGIAALRSAIADYTAGAVHEHIGIEGQAALGRGDLDGARRRCPPADRLATLIRLFMLGCAADEADVSAALAPLPIEQAAAAGLVECSGGEVRSGLDLRPYEDGWVVSDLGSDVRPGPLARDHVLGVGSASVTLAQATVDLPASRALDIGTGCGVQALHLSRRSPSVVATDVSLRALRFAATTAALSGERWDLRHGSLLDPVDGAQFDLVVSNPPFVLSPGRRAYDYRDSGLAGDGVTRALVRGIPKLLAPSGFGQLLGNWAITAEGDWQERAGEWLHGSGCDAWVWQREVAEPGEYVALWLRDAGEQPGTAPWSAQYDAWLDWFERERILAVGMGLITMRRTDRDAPLHVLEDVRQAVEQPSGPAIADWFAAHDLLATTTDDKLLDARPARAGEIVRTTDQLTGPDGWRAARQVLRQSRGMRWEIEIDDAMTALVAGCDGATPLRVVLGLLASALGSPIDDVAAAALPVVRDLIARGFLHLPTAAP